MRDNLISGITFIPFILDNEKTISSKFSISILLCNYYSFNVLIVDKVKGKKYRSESMHANVSIHVLFVVVAAIPEKPPTANFRLFIHFARFSFTYSSPFTKHTTLE